MTDETWPEFGSPKSFSTLKYLRMFFFFPPVNKDTRQGAAGGEGCEKDKNVKKTDWLKEKRHKRPWFMHCWSSLWLSSLVCSFFLLSFCLGPSAWDSHLWLHTQSGDKSQSDVRILHQWRRVWLKSKGSRQSGSVVMKKKGNCCRRQGYERWAESSHR